MMCDKFTVSYNIPVCPTTWGFLRSTYSETVHPVGCECLVFGTSEDSHVSFQHPHIAKLHCLIMRDPEGDIWLCDTSDQGTLINRSLLVKNDQTKLCRGDTFHLFTDPEDPSSDIGFTLEFSESAPTNEGTVKTEERSEQKINEPPVTTSSTVPTSSVMTDLDVENCLTCAVCGNIFYECCSLQPCLHSFCTLCWLQWKPISSICPVCRQPVKGFGKNHQLNQLTELYLKQNPDKRRNSTERRDIDQKIETLKASTPAEDERQGSTDPEAYNSWYTESEDSTEESNTRCIVCGWTGVTDNNPQHCAAHETCCCCGAIIPKYQHNPEEENKVECAGCQRSYCNLLRSSGCPMCYGRCLLPLSRLAEVDDLPPNLLLGNYSETRILKEYLQAHHISNTEFRTRCLNYLDASLFPGHEATVNTIVCYDCANRCLSHLAYQYRAAIPSSEFPDAVTSRPDCYYGRFCRTQRTNPMHALRYNHICEQTRFDDASSS